MATTRSGVITFTGSAQALSGLITDSPQVIYLAIDQDNSNEVYVGNNGSDSVAAASGFVLHPDGVLGVKLHITQWQNMYILGTNGEKATWMRV